MAIVCRKCNYEISKEEINEHYIGFLLHFAKATIELTNNLFSCFRKKTDESPEVKQENILLARANEYKIRCPQCFQYNGWIKIADKLDDEIKTNH